MNHPQFQEISQREPAEYCTHELLQFEVLDLQDKLHYFLSGQTKSNPINYNAPMTTAFFNNPLPHQPPVYCDIGYREFDDLDLDTIGTFHKNSNLFSSFALYNYLQFRLYYNSSAINDEIASMLLHQVRLLYARFMATSQEDIDQDNKQANQNLYKQMFVPLCKVEFTFDNQT